MSQSLVINGKKYIPSGEVAAEVRYSSDYISRLAREERILGTQIGRQWFIEPYSLKTYLEQIKIEKEISKEHLRKVRKIEHKAPINSKGNVEVKKQSVFDFGPFAQAFTVLACGLFIGGLGWVTAAEDLSSSDVIVGVEEIASYIALSVYPFESPLHFSGDSRSFTAATAESSRYISREAEVNEEFGVYTQLPQFPPRLTQVEPSRSSVLIQDHFSDEVIVSDDGQGTVMLKPVFKNSVSNENFFVVTPSSSTQ